MLQVVNARTAHRDTVVLPRLGAARSSGEYAALPVLPLPTSMVAPEEGVVQVIDAAVYPANPSCPFPTPTATPSPTPAPGPRVTLSSGGACLWFNASAYPCFGSNACALTMGSCSAPGARWYLPQQAGTPAALVSADVTAPTGGPVVVNIDCDNFTAAHTVAWALSSGGASFVYTASSKQLQIASPGGLCLNEGIGPARPACNPADPWQQAQVQLAPCTDPSTRDWLATVV